MRPAGGYMTADCLNALIDSALAGAQPQPCTAPPSDLTHGMNCPGTTPLSDDDCTCGLKWRIQLQTEREMHAAWRKRAEEAETANEALKAAEGELEIWLCQVHRSLDDARKLEPLDNCVACIRAERNELRTACAEKDAAATRCAEYLNVPLKNPSGEPFDELAQAVQSMPTWAGYANCKSDLESKQGEILGLKLSRNIQDGVIEQLRSNFSTARDHWQGYQADCTIYERDLLVIQNAYTRLIGTFGARGDDSRIPELVALCDAIEDSSQQGDGPQVVRRKTDSPLLALYNDPEFKKDCAALSVSLAETPKPCSRCGGTRIIDQHAEMSGDGTNLAPCPECSAPAVPGYNQRTR